MKKGIVVVLVILLTAIAGFLVPVLMNRDGSGRLVDITGGETSKPKATGEKTPKAVNTQIASNVGEIETPLKTKKPEYTSDISIVLSSPSVTPKNTESSVEEASPEPVATLSPVIEPTPTKKNNSGSWVDRKIEEHRDEIDSDDLADFRRIYSSVDIGYIQGLMQDGLDDEETSKLKAYLRNTLGGDYERAKELFYEYSYLLSEV
ncbi:MAG: hypothetical protein BWY74_04194 [Firmicutes bacterium ADurb.Bin419]|nr:MAG: hypothetical protein BWY74_04194 [Firmicutes bacterium ADurb.Bin419]